MSYIVTYVQAVCRLMAFIHFCLHLRVDSGERQENNTRRERGLVIPLLMILILSSFFFFLAKSVLGVIDSVDLITHKLHIQRLEYMNK